MVLSIGEILVDIFKSEDKKEVFAGGAPFNVACNIIRFNGDVSFYGAVGNDSYGDFLINYAKKKSSHFFVKRINNCYTSQAMVTVVDGERSFKFVRDQGADYDLDINDLNHFDFAKLKIVHVGSLMLSCKEGREFFDASIDYIRRHSNALVSFDVNYRDDIFSNPEEAKNIFLNALQKADVIKFTEEELELLTGLKSIEQGLKQLLSDKQLAVVTLGKEGSVFYKNGKYIKVPSYPLKPVDTTGAGDAFYSYFLYALDKGLDLNDDSAIKDTLLRANVVGGLATQKKGAIDVAPNLEEIDKFISNH